MKKKLIKRKNKDMSLKVYVFFYGSLSIVGVGLSFNPAPLLHLGVILM